MKIVFCLLLLILGFWGKRFFEEIKPQPELNAYLPLGKRFEQQLIRGVLGGWRPVVADIAWLRVTTSWENRQWNRLYENVRIATRTQPESLLFWDMGAWHLAWNASLAERNNRLEARIEVRKEKELYWAEKGKNLLEEGTIYHPTHFKLWLQLGLLHQERRHDYVSAYECFLKSSQFNGAPSYVARMAGYALEKQGDPAAVLNYWEKLLEKSPDRPDRGLIEKRLLKLKKETTLDPLKPIP